MALLPRIASGVAGWLTYEHMCRQVIHHEEATIYRPIIQIAESNGFKVKREFPIPSRSKRGKNSQKEVDFVMISRAGMEAVVLEVKFKKQAKDMAGSIGEDALKIRDLNAAKINTIIRNKSVRLPICKPGCKVSRAVLFVWRRGDIVSEIRKKEPKPIQAQFVALLKYMFDDPNKVSTRMLPAAILTSTPIKPVSNYLGHVRWGSTFTTSRYWVAVLRRRSDWAKL
jgi:hypothetical protein